MKYFVFENPGVMDVRSITTFGVSSKDSPNTAIGFFGTGLKYAIAILLRNGCSITIYTGDKKLTFGVEETKIRNDEFNIVTMQDGEKIPQQLGFTTELGKTWDVWQAMRELHCNCVDENGFSYETEKMSRHPKEATRVIVQGSAFDLAWMQRNSIFLKSEAIHIGKFVNIHPGTSEWVFYRGIRTSKLSRPSRFTYNIMSVMSMTEDRSFKYDWYVNSNIAHEISMMSDQSIIDPVIVEPNDGMWEQALSFASTPLGAEITACTLRQMKEFNPNLNKSLKSRLREHSFESFIRDDTAAMLFLDQKRLKKSLKFLHDIGYDCSEFPIIVTSSLSEGVLGQAHGGKIYLSTRVFLMGTKMVAGTILEEYLHLKHKLIDCDRDMQNFLFDALISMGEQVLGDVL